MKKIGRNDPCPCGSGKKYKQCYLKQQCNGAGVTTSTAKQSVMSFDDLLLAHNSVQILGLLGALQLNPENHGRNFRFEELCIATLRRFDPEDNKPLASWERLKAVIENYTDEEMMEDPLSNAFTEIAIFEEGNYMVYPGIYDGFTEILNNLTECIFLQKHALNPEFVKKVRNAVGLLLFINESVAREAGHEPFLYQESASDNITFPEYEKTALYTEALYFTKAFLIKVCEAARFDICVLDDFTIQPGVTELYEDDPEDNVVNFKPFAEIKGAILLYMPTAIPHTLVSYVYQKAKEYNCYEELIALLYQRQFHLSCLALSQTGWLYTDIQLPTADDDLSVIETVFQFDNQKLAYVCYLKTGGMHSEDAGAPQRPNQVTQHDARANEIVQYLSSINPEQPFAVFCLYIIGETANDYFFTWGKRSVGHHSLALKYRELQTITHAPKVNSLTLWKFAKCYSRTSELTNLFSMGGAMDAFAIYIKNHGSLLDSEEARPMGGMLMIVNSSSDDLRRAVQRVQNEHAVPVFYKGRRAYAKVSRFKEYAPIYIQRESTEYFKIVIETYKIPIWITNPQTKANNENWATNICEAIAFWLNKMEPLLAPHFNEQPFIQFEIEITIAEELINAEQFEIEDVNIDNIQLAFEIVQPIIRIGIPFDYIYAVMQSNNIADKILMGAVLQGIATYIDAAGNLNSLNAAIINDIIERTLQPAEAKMLLFSDASANIKLDARNLPPMRYVNETDISYILDNLVSYLPEGYPIPDNIPEKNDKIRLCDDIVTSLLKQITNKLVDFEGKGLLEWLIRSNEKCIQLREFQEILIPAKIACFSNFETEVEQLIDEEQNLVTTALATRVLIEFVASNIPGGTRWPNFDDVDELLALTSQLISWGALSEVMRMGIDDPKMGLLDSGRIGTDKTMELGAFKPYSVAKTESALFRSIEDFENKYVPIRRNAEAIETEESKSLDAAFKAEFGITLTTLSKITGALVNEGFTRAIACVDMPEAQLMSTLSKIKDVTAEDVSTAIKLMTLLERKGIGIPPKGYSSIDIFPWRYNRSISYIRRPLVRIIKNDFVHYLYGYRHLMQFIDHLLYLLQSSKLPGVKSDEMKSWLAAASGGKGNPFREAVKKWFEERTKYEVVPYEIQMDKDAPKGHIKTEKPYGDIDLLVIDHGNRTIFPIECKNIQGGRNVHEMKVEMDDYLGRDGYDKKAKMRKHVDRDRWLNEHRGALAELVPNAEDYLIRSIILTADEIPLAYLKKNDLMLPVKSFTLLRKKGTSFLSEP